MSMCLRQWPSGSRAFLHLTHLFFWCLAHDKMLTDENLCSCDCALASICNLCFQSDETSEHLFICC